MKLFRKKVLRGMTMLLSAIIILSSFFGPLGLRIAKADTTSSSTSSTNISSGTTTTTTQPTASTPDTTSTGSTSPSGAVPSPGYMPPGQDMYVSANTDGTYYVVPQGTRVNSQSDLDSTPGVIKVVVSNGAQETLPLSELPEGNYDLYFVDSAGGISPSNPITIGFSKNPLTDQLAKIYQNIPQSELWKINQLQPKINNLTQDDINYILGTATVNKIDSLTGQGTSNQLVKAIASLLYYYDPMSIASQLDQFRAGYSNDFHTIFGNSVTSDTLLNFYNSYLQNAKVQLIGALGSSNSLDGIDVKAVAKQAFIVTENESQFAEFKASFKKNLGLNLSDLVSIKNRLEEKLGVGQDVKAALMTGLVKSNGGSLYDKTAGSDFGPATKQVVVGDNRSYELHVTNGKANVDLPLSNWTSSDPNVASFNGATLIAHRSGGVTITSSTKNYPLFTQYITVGGAVTTDNVQGLATYSNNQPLDFGNLFIQKILATGETGTSTVKIAPAITDHHGHFSLQLSDGQYEVVGVQKVTQSGMPDSSQPFDISTPIHFSVVNGQLEQNGAVVNLLEITPQQPNVQGTVYQDKAQTTVIPNAKLSVTQVDGNGFGQSWNVNANQDGQFKLALVPGTYSVDGFFDPATGVWVNLNQTFTVTSDDTGINPKAIEVSPQTTDLSGTVNGSDGTAFNNATLEFQAVDSNGQLTGPTYSAPVSSGSYSVYLPDGSYQITGIQTSSGWINYGKTVDVSSTNPTTFNIDLSKDFVHGTFKDKTGQPVTNGYVEIQNKTSGDTYTPQTDENGEFYVALPDGNYTVVGGNLGQSNNNQWIDLNVGFSVTNETPNPSPLVVHPPQDTASGTAYIDAAQSQPLDQGYLDFNQIDTNNNVTNQVWTPTNAKGQFSVYLPAGTYTIQYQDQNGMIHQAKTASGDTITIQTGTVLSNLVIYPPKKDFFGIAYQDSGLTNPVSYGSLQVRQDIPFPQPDASGQIPSDAVWPQVFSIPTGPLGKFSYSLPDGNYILQGIGTQDHFIDINQKFSITNGNLSIGGVAQPNGWNIAPPKPNITGQVLDTTGNPVNNGGFYVMENKNFQNGEQQQGYFIPTKNDGTFAYNLPASANGYLIMGISTQNNTNWIDLSNYSMNLPDPSQSKYWFNLNSQGQIVKADGSTSSTLTIQPPIPNLIGTVTGAGEEVNGISIMEDKPVPTSSTASAQDWPKSYWTNVDPITSSFNLSVPPGKYQVMGVSTKSGKWIDLSGESVTIQAPDPSTASTMEPVTVNIPTVNFKGKAYDSNHHAVPYGDLEVKPTDSTNPNDTKWIPINYNGEFDGILDFANHNYVIVGMDTPSGFVTLNQPIDPNASSIDVYAPAKNVSGTVKDSHGSLVINGVVEFLPKTLDPNTSKWDQAIYAQTNGQGQYATNLSDGTYQVIGIGTNTGWTPLTQTVTVSGKTTIDVDAQSAVNVNASVVNNGAPVKEAQVFYQSSTDSNVNGTIYMDKNGFSSVQLPDGSYEITNVYDPVQDKWFNLPKPIPFNVSNGNVKNVLIDVTGM